MIARYTLPEMGALWTDEARMRAWLAVEIAAVRAWSTLGKVPPEAVAEIEEKADFDPVRVAEIEHTTDDIVRAAEVVDRLPLGAEQQARLRAEVLECALDVTRRDVIAANGSAPMIFTYPLNEHGVRVGLEATYRSLARQAHTTSERIQLVDLANRVRPRTIV